MCPAGQTHELDDPAVLSREARALLGTREDARPLTALESDIQRAFKLTVAELTKANALRKQQPVPYESLFNSHDKLAALTMLIRHLLLDVALGPAQVQDTIDGRADLSTAIEALVQLQAVDALGLLYDFTCTQQAVSVPEFWQKASTYYLHLIAKSNARPRAIQFLKDRPQARRHVEQLMAAQEPAIAAVFRALGEDYVRIRRETDPNAPSPDPPMYVRLYQAYQPYQQHDEVIGQAVLLAAEERIRQAVAQNELLVVVQWIAQGSPDAIRAAFKTARENLPTSGYVKVLEQVLKQIDLPLVTLAAAVLELGEASRSLNPQGGEEGINRVLSAFASTRDKDYIGVSKLAVRELREANAFNDIVNIMERTPVIEVAEEGMRMMCEMRRLPMVEAVVLKRPILSLSFQQAQKHLLTIQELMNAAWGCTSDATAKVYLERLKELKAFPELEQLGKRHKQVGDLANRTLTELRLEESTRARRY